MLFIAPAESRDSMERTLAMNQALGIEATMVAPAEVRRISPNLEVPEDVAAVWEPRSGYASPHDVAASFARRFVGLGGELLQETPVTAIEVWGGRVRGVRTPGGAIAAAHVVIAAGLWAGPVGRLAGLELPVTASVEPIVTIRPPYAWPSHHPVVADLVNEVYLRPETGGLMLVGNTRDTIVPGDPDACPNRPSGDETLELLTRLARLVPKAASAPVTGGWCGMYEVSPDWNPIMGSAREVAGLHYAVGFSGHGFKLSPAVGILMAEQVMEGRARTIDIAPYRLERFGEGQELRVAYRGAGVIG
jgi:sarcosine oxidase subunit beta